MTLTHKKVLNTIHLSCIQTNQFKTGALTVTLLKSVRKRLEKIFPWSLAPKFSTSVMQWTKRALPKVSLRCSLK